MEISYIIKGDEAVRIALIGVCLYGLYKALYLILQKYSLRNCRASERFETEEQALNASFNELDFEARPEWCDLCRCWHRTRLFAPLGVNDAVKRQREWSEATFGEGPRTLGITRHIEKEIAEIRSSPFDTEEWVDVVLLGMDGYWRAGGVDLFGDMVKKQNRNTKRKYLRTGQDEPSEHDRSVPEE